MENFNFFITTTKYQDNASHLAQQWGMGVVLVVDSVTINNGSTANVFEESEIITLQVSYMEGFESSTYTDSEIEKSFLQTGIIYSSESLSLDLDVFTHAVSLPACALKSEETIMSYIAETLRNCGNFVMVVMSDNSTNNHDQQNDR